MNDLVTLVIIDDNQDDRLLYRRTLQNSKDINYHFIEAADGEMGLNLIDEEQPSCILLDYSLPGRNGIEVLKRIRSRHPFIPVVMMTGQGNEKVAVVAIQQGAQNYISKSTITLEALEHVIHMAIEHCILEKRVHDQRTALEVFTRALAHDLKEPVRTIRSFTELLNQRENFAGPSKDYFTHIQNASDRMLTLIDTVFLYTRLDEPGLITKEMCDLSEVLREVKENIAQLIRERGTVITAASLPTVYANRAQMIQLLQNLLCNAINHSVDPVSIYIRASAQSDYWQFSIVDNGPGIEADYLQKIFEPFKRMGQFENQGAGLGLAICKKIVEAQDGRIWCESQPGKGTTFMFTLPRTLPVVTEVRHSASEVLIVAEPALLKKKPLANVLLVDDSQADIEMARFRLTERAQLQCNLHVAGNAKEALTLLRSGVSGGGQVDLLLLDINMPEVDGFELLERVRADPLLQQLIIVMCTGSIYDKDMTRAQELGASGYLTKPIDFSKLQSVLAKNSSLRLSQEGEAYTLWRAA